MSCRATVLAAVVEVAGIDPDVVSDDSTLEAIGIDSLDLIEVSMIVEDAYPIEPRGEDFDGVDTFGGAVAVFDRLILDAGS